MFLGKKNSSHNHYQTYSRVVRIFELGLFTLYLLEMKVIAFATSIEPGQPAFLCSVTRFLTVEL
jgi:hypothetical protein